MQFKLTYEHTKGHARLQADRLLVSATHRHRREVCLDPGMRKQCVSGLCLALQDELADGAGPSGDQQDEPPQPDALEQEAAAAVRPDEANCKPATATLYAASRFIKLCFLHLAVSTLDPCNHCRLHNVLSGGNS